MKHILFLVLLFGSIFGKAQEVTSNLITDRPDQTESSSVVPLKSLQIETGFVMENDETEFNKQKSFAYNTTLLRYGLLANLELRLGLEYLKDRVEMKNRGTENITSGFSPLYAGFKIKIANENNWKPELALLGGLVLPFTAQEDFKPTYTSVNFRFAFTHTLSERFSLGYNLGAEWDGESAISGYYYSLVLGMGISNNIGMFIESYGLMHNEGASEHLLDSGFTFLVLPNLQFDISAGIGINNEALDNFISFGLSYRLPE